MQFSDRAFIYCRDDKTVAFKDGRACYTWRRTDKRGNMKIKVLPETMIGLAVAESFARDSGITMNRDGRLREGDQWLRLFVQQTPDATQVFFRKDPERENDSRLVAAFKPRFSIEYRSGLEALKIELANSGNWPIPRNNYMMA